MHRCVHVLTKPVQDFIGLALTLLNISNRYPGVDALL